MPRETKPCSSCGFVLPVAQFSRNRKARDGLAYTCKSCAAEAHAEWYARPGNAARMVAKVKSWRKTPRGRVLRREQVRRQEARPERARQKRASAARYRAAHLGSVRHRDRVYARGKRYAARARDMAGWL